MACKFYINDWIFVRKKHANFVLAHVVIFWVLTNICIRKYARVQTAVKWLQRACWCSTNSCRGKQAPRRAGSLAELQKAAERQLGFASGSLSWATSRIANSCRETAGLCKLLAVLGH